MYFIIYLYLSPLLRPQGHTFHNPRSFHTPLHLPFSVADKYPPQSLTQNLVIHVRLFHLQGSVQQLPCFNLEEAEKGVEEYCHYQCLTSEAKCFQSSQCRPSPRSPSSSLHCSLSSHPSSATPAPMLMVSSNAFVTMPMLRPRPLNTVTPLHSPSLWVC